MKGSRRKARASAAAPVDTYYAAVSSLGLTASRYNHRISVGFYNSLSTPLYVVERQKEKEGGEGKKWACRAASSATKAESDGHIVKVRGVAEAESTVAPPSITG